MVQLDSYQNEREDDCIPASFGNLENIVFDTFVPDVDVQSFYRGHDLPGVERWFLSRIVPGQTYFRALQWVFIGMGTKKKPKCFGSIALNRAALTAAIAKYKAVSVGLAGAHQVDIRRNAAGNLEIVDSIAGLIPDPYLVKYFPLLDSAKAFNFEKFDWPLVLGGMLVNLKVWSAVAFLLALIGYTAWRVM